MLLLACGALVLLSALFLLRPFRRPGEAPEDVKLTHKDIIKM